MGPGIFFRKTFQAAAASEALGCISKVACPVALPHSTRVLLPPFPGRVKLPAQMPRFAALASNCSDSYVLTKPVAKPNPAAPAMRLHRCRPATCWHPCRLDPSPAHRSPPGECGCPKSRRYRRRSPTLCQQWRLAAGRSNVCSRRNRVRR